MTFLKVRVPSIAIHLEPLCTLEAEKKDGLQENNRPLEELKVGRYSNLVAEPLQICLITLESKEGSLVS